MQVPTDVTTTSSALPQGQVPRVQQAQPTSNDHCPSCGEFVGAAAALAGTTIMGAVTGAGGGAMMGLLVKGGDLLADRMFGDSGVNIPMREAVIGGAAIMSVIMGATSCLNACFAAPAGSDNEVTLSDIEMALGTEAARELAIHLDRA